MHFDLTGVMIAMGVGMALMSIGILVVIAIRQMASKGSSPLLPFHLFRRNEATSSVAERPPDGSIVREEVSDSSVSPLIREDSVDPAPVHAQQH